ISVDLPEPEGPMTAVSLPASISRETSRSASTAVSPLPNRRERPTASTTTSDGTGGASGTRETASAWDIPFPPCGLTYGNVAAGGSGGKGASRRLRGAVSPTGQGGEPPGTLRARSSGGRGRATGPGAD